MKIRLSASKVNMNPMDFPCGTCHPIYVARANGPLVNGQWCLRLAAKRSLANLTVSKISNSAVVPANAMRKWPVPGFSKLNIDRR